MDRPARKSDEVRSTKTRPVLKIKVPGMKSVAYLSLKLEVQRLTSAEQEAESQEAESPEEEAPAQESVVGWKNADTGARAAVRRTMDGKGDIWTEGSAQRTGAEARRARVHRTGSSAYAYSRPDASSRIQRLLGRMSSQAN